MKNIFIRGAFALILLLSATLPSFAKTGSKPTQNPYSNLNAPPTPYLSQNAFPGSSNNDYICQNNEFFCTLLIGIAAGVLIGVTTSGHNHTTNSVPSGPPQT